MILWRPRSFRPRLLSKRLPPRRRFGAGGGTFVSHVSDDRLFGRDDLDPDGEGPDLCGAEGADAHHMA